MATNDKEQQIEYHLNCIRILMKTTRTNDFTKRFELLERKVDVLFKKLDCLRSIVNLKTEDADMSWLSEFCEDEQAGGNDEINIDTEIDLEIGKEVEIPK